MRLNLMLGVFWLFASSTLLIMIYLDKEGQHFSKTAPWFGALGLVLAAYNFARWWAARAAEKARAAQPPPQRRPVGPPEYHAEFDFNRPEKPKGNNGTPAKG
ncbi:MAG TPA: hypothetical protein VGZ47_17905 [Gemmataceae bacterium]|jgi:hypothetical protein|nr:hypothetical protein [Gemmataceae bacterium]